MRQFITVFVIFLYSCITKPNKQVPLDANHDSSGVSVNNAREDFSVFFERFKTDSLFQLERTRFPFRVLMSIDDGDTVEETSKEDWEHSNFYYDTAYASRKVDAYTQKIQRYGDTVKLEIRGIDNGMYTDFEFVAENGKWLLVSAKDFSN